MKAFFVLAALVAVGCASPVTFGLKDDLQDFLNLVPREKVHEIVVRYLSSDAEVIEAFDYLQSDDFKTIVSKLNATPEFHQYLTYLENAGLDVYALLKKITELLDLPEITKPTRMTSEVLATGGWRGMMEELQAVLPLDEIKALFHEKLQTSPAFKELYDKIKNSDYKNIVNRLLAIPEVQELVNKVKAHGVDLQKIVAFVKKIFGWAY